MALKRLGLVLAAVSLLAGCATIKTSKIGTMVAGATGGKAAGPGGAVPRAQIEKLGKPVLFVRVATRNAETLLLPSSSRGTVTTWATGDASTVTLRDGVLISTRGLGPDLMSASVPSPAQLLSGQGHRRSYFPIGDNDRTDRQDFTCTTANRGAANVTIVGKVHATTRVTESCTGADGTITNDYWFEAGKIRQSREWASPTLGYLDIARIID